jgi:uncharacterized protein YdiU (UPF0061 family)
MRLLKNHGSASARGESPLKKDMLENPTLDLHPGGWRFDHSYKRLPEIFYSEANPVAVREPGLAIFNHALAQSLGLDADILDSTESAAIFAGNAIPDGASPIAQAYAGHQFGHFTMLGDGRAILLGEHLAPDGCRFDIQLKGSGRTPFSRRGDGRATLGPMLREYIISEAMHALGIPTTRSLAVATTGEGVIRETELPGAVLTRVAASHIRVGTFEFAAARGGLDDLRALAAHTLARHFPKNADAQNPALALLEGVIERQSALIAQWLLVGFIHGVMNTDNMALSGETIDYGPCAFMDVYDPATVFSSIDRQGRYAYGNQAGIAQWNLTRLAEALLPLLDADESRAVELAQEALGKFAVRFEFHWLEGMSKKIGLFTNEAGDLELIKTLLEWMQRTRADYTNTLRDLDPRCVPTNSDLEFREWHALWVSRLSRQPQTHGEAVQLLRRHNPAIIPRNHKVEEALDAAVERGDYGPLKRLLAVISRPYDDTEGNAEFRSLPPAGSCEYQTFCGT